MTDSKNLVEVTYIVPVELQDIIAEKIAEQVKSSYYFEIGKILAERISKDLAADGFTTRVAEAVLAKVKISETEYVTGLTEQIRTALLETTSIISKEVLKKVNEKVQTYGFIQIGR
jgi:actin-like ATPase involved in cell morphogenesis